MFAARAASNQDRHVGGVGDVGTPREIDQRVIRKISDMMDRLFSQQCWMTNRPERIAEEFLSSETRWCRRW